MFPTIDGGRSRKRVFLVFAKVYHESLHPTDGEVPDADQVTLYARGQNTHATLTAPWLAVGLRRMILQR